MKHEDMAEYLNIKADDSGIYEYENNRILVFLPKEKIKEVTYGYGYIFRFPAAAFAVGVILVVVGLAFGVWPIVATVISDAPTGFNKLKGFGLISLFIIFGSWLAFAALRKTHFIMADTTEGINKLMIRGRFDRLSSEQFINQLKLKYRLS